MAHGLSESVQRRFWSKIAAGPNCCWAWTDKTYNDGYGRLATTRSQGPIKAHRVSMMLHLDRALAVDEHIDHLCRNRRCVNPDHLEVVTVQENSKRQWQYTSRSETCPQGHNDWGTRAGRNGEPNRRCMECHRQQERARTQRKATKRQLTGVN
jgi:hypothetical protein